MWSDHSENREGNPDIPLFSQWNPPGPFGGPQCISRSEQMFSQSLPKQIAQNSFEIWDTAVFYLSYVIISLIITLMKVFITAGTQAPAGLCLYFQLIHWQSRTSVSVRGGSDCGHRGMPERQDQLISMWTNELIKWFCFFSLIPLASMKAKANQIVSHCFGF